MTNIIHAHIFAGLFIVSLFTFANPSFAAASADILIQQCDGENCTEIDDQKLSKSFTIGEKIPLRITIFNPEKAPVYSVQSWIKYNPTIFSISNLSDTESAFPLAAPGEFKAMNDDGELRIGRAVAGDAVQTDRIIVADFEIEIKKNPNGAVLEFMNFSSESIGKTAVVTIGNNVPANILSTHPKGLTFESLAAAPKVYSRPDDLESVQNGTQVYGINRDETQTDIEDMQDANPEFIALPRPQGFRSRTYEDGRTEHLWQMGEDSRIQGYYLYYSTTSGTYMHRRDMGKTNSYRFADDFFEKGKRVYFAVQAYTGDGKLSDFSDEAYVVVGSEGSESHPFFEQIFPDAQSTGSDDTNIYYGADITDDETTTQTTEKNTNTTSLPKPNTTSQSGIDIPFHWLLLMGGGMMFFAGRMVLKEA